MTCLRKLLWFALAAIVILGVQRTAPSQSLLERAAGRVQIIDGDTIALDGRLIQLYGIDAPELGQVCLHATIEQKCGLISARALHKLVAMTQAPIHCVPAGAYGRISMASCWMGVHDLAQVLVADGYAVATPDGRPGYLEQQREAREAELGLWHGVFMLPSEWRSVAAGREGGDFDCNVKAVVEPDGTRHFYVPLDEGYDGIALIRDRGDVLFCSDEAAIDAGWTWGGRDGTDTSGSDQLLRGRTVSTSFAQNVAP